MGYGIFCKGYINKVLILIKILGKYVVRLIGI